MSNRHKEVRRDIIDVDSPLSRHSMNQRKMGFNNDGEKRMGPTLIEQRRIDRESRKSITLLAGNFPYNRDIFDLQVEKVRQGRGTQFSVGYVSHYLERLNEELTEEKGD